MNRVAFRTFAMLAMLIGFSTTAWGQTYWMGRKPANDNKVYYDVQVPDFFAKWIAAASPQGQVRQVNGQNYEFHTMTFTWDNQGSNPKASGQIRIDKPGQEQWQAHDKTQWGAFRDQLYALAPAGHWSTAKDVSFVKTSGATDPQLAVAFETYWLGRRPANEDKVYFDVQVPGFFMPWVKQQSPGASTTTLTANSKSYTAYRQSFKWDTQGSSPKRTGQINVLGTTDWHQNNALKSGTFVDALYGLAAPAHWQTADVCVVKSDGSTHPNLTLPLSDVVKVAPGYGTLRYHEILSNASQQTNRPYDVRFDTNVFVPKIVPFANSDGSVSVAWKPMAPAQTIIVSTFSGTNFTTASHVTISSAQGALDQLAGYVKDGTGNGYVLTAKTEKAGQTEWGTGLPHEGLGPWPTDAAKLRKWGLGPGTHRSNVVSLLKIAKGGTSASAFADANSKTYSNATMYNPLGGQTSDLAFSNNSLGFTIPHSWGWDLDLKNNNTSNPGYHQRHSLLAIGTDAAKTARYRENGLMYHSAGTRIAAEKTGFVAATTWEEGVGISKLTVDASEMKWSGHRHIFYSGGGQNFTRLGGIGVGTANYAVAYLSGTNPGNLWSGYSDGDRLNVYFSHSIPFNFAAEKWDDKAIPAKYRSTTNPRNFTSSYASENASARNLKMVSIERTAWPGRFTLIWEKWVNGSYDSTWAVAADEGGGCGGPVRVAENPRIQEGADGVFVKAGGKKYAAWVTGDTIGKKLELHMIEVDDGAAPVMSNNQVAYQSHDLNLP